MNIFSLVSLPKCNQTRNQLETLRRAKSFLRGTKIFKLCPIVLSYVQHIFPGGRKNFLGGKVPCAPIPTGLNVGNPCVIM